MNGRRLSPGGSGNSTTRINASCSPKIEVFSKVSLIFGLSRATPDMMSLLTVMKGTAQNPAIERATNAAITARG